MLNINPDIVRQIIQNAREFHVKVQPPYQDDSAQNPEEYDWLQSLADHKGDLTYQQTVEAIDDLEPDQQVTLVAMLYVGRGDYDLKEWKTALKEAKYNWNEKTGEYLMAHPLLADHLEEALTQLGYTVESEE